MKPNHRLGKPTEQVDFEIFFRVKFLLSSQSFDPTSLTLNFVGGGIVASATREPIWYAQFNEECQFHFPSTTESSSSNVCSDDHIMRYSAKSFLPYLFTRFLFRTDNNDVVGALLREEKKTINLLWLICTLSVSGCFVILLGKVVKYRTHVSIRRWFVDDSAAKKKVKREPRALLARMYQKTFFHRCWR